jgi:hypothetical protein
MKTILFVLSLSVSFFANATSLTLEDHLALQVRMDKANLEVSIKSEIIKELGGTGVGSLKDFSVDWKSLRCVVAIPSEFEPKTVGACVVSVSAFQVNAQVSITKAQNSSKVNVIYADVE